MVIILLLCVTYILNVIDYIFSAHWIHLYGLEVEANPIYQWMYKHNIDWVVKIFVAAGIYALIGYIIYRYPKYAWMTYPLFLFYVGIVIYHIFLTVLVL